MATASIQPKPGILLSVPEWNYPSSSSSSSSTSSPPSSSRSSLTSATPTPTNTTTFRQPSPSTAMSRKIRFAPLPDPRRAVLVDENGDELPIPDGEEATRIPCPISPAVAPATDLQVQDTSSLSSFGSSKRNSDTDPSTTPGTTTPASTVPSECENSRPGSPSWSPITLPPPLPNTKVQSISVTQFPKAKGLSIFRPFKRSSGSSSSSSNSLTPTPSIDRTGHANSGRKSISTEEILTLGTINLFRTSSRDSSKSVDSNSGWSLTRWASTGGSHPPVKQWGVPLTRTQSSQSTQSYRSKTKTKTPSLLSGLRPTSPPGGSRSKAVPNRKGTRMLNGRVYGGRRLDPNANLFANAPDEEPEFVEWGHGGMGSVKGARSAGVGNRWERLHGSGQDENLDDGGGMAWVKKRREAREQKEREEREAREKAEKEAAEKEAAENATAVDTNGNESESTGEVHEEENIGALPAIVTPTTPSISESAMPTPRASSPDISSINPLFKASSVSVNTHHSTSTAVPASPTIPPTSPSREFASPPSSAPLVPAEDDHIFTTMAVPMPRPHHRPRSNTRDGTPNPLVTLADVEGKDKGLDATRNRDSGTESESESSSDSDRDDDESDDDSDEEDEEEEARRRAMVIGAGMEKVSRHRAEVEDQHS